ncbi:MAG: hypothetical protein ACRCUT_05330, partial [Spirochaetota bacterium]
YMAMSYINKKELYVYRSGSTYVLDNPNRMITVIPENNSYRIVFLNNTYFNRIVGLENPGLTERLLKNAIFFCVPNGEMETTTETGETIYIPIVEAVSMCTVFYKDSADWKSSAMIFGTRNKNLKQMMEDAKKQFDTPKED